MPFPKPVAERLTSTYEELMWLAKRPNVTPQRARAWYTAVIAEQLRTAVRRFTGKVSRAALADLDQPLVLEHYNRLASSISELLKEHTAQGISNPAAFLELIEACERVNITTKDENAAAQKAKGDYEKAGIELVEWRELSYEARAFLWSKMLKGKVSNAAAFDPQPRT